ncbi:MAG: ATP-binding protein [Candidatus Zixiibacteriota bacterium]
MFVYNRRATNPNIRPGWVITTRVVAFAVTTALAWPLLSRVPGMGTALLIYAGVTAATISVRLLERRRIVVLFGPLLRVMHIACELFVISMIVSSTGGIQSPSIFLYLMTIISAAISYRLIGTLIVASAATVSYLAVIWIDAGQTAAILNPRQWLGSMQQLPDEQFFAIFVRICIFYLCAFSGGYLAERLWTHDKALAHTTRALEVAKLETGDILKHLQSGILTVDLNGRIVFFNRAAEEILGMSSRQVRGQTIHEAFGHQFPELAERLDNIITSRKMDVRMELMLQRADGRTAPIGLSTSFLGGRGTDPRGVIGIFQDLTEAKMMEEKMRVQDRLAAIGELSAAIAHEIRNPLAAISGSVEVLRNELPVEGDNRRLMELIIKESGRLNKILTEFLSYARIRPTVTGRVIIAPVLDEVLEIARQRFQGTSIPVLRVRQTDHELAVRADSDHLKQLLINLVFNAIESIERERGGEVLISVQAAADEDLPDDLPPDAHTKPWVAIAVQDNGVGIPESVRTRLFEPFVSSKPNGTGLGLAIVQRLTENAGGHIRVESTPNVGSTFTIILPRITAHEPEKPKLPRLLEPEPV